MREHLIWRTNHWRQRALIDSLGSFGQGAEIGGTVVVYSPDRLHIGDRSFVNDQTVILAGGGVWIGADVMISAACKITSTTHPVSRAARRTVVYESVRIEDGVWLGIGSTVLSGVTVGRDAIVGAGAVVTRDVEPGQTVVGIPARPLPAQTAGP